VTVTPTVWDASLPEGDAANDPAGDAETDADGKAETDADGDAEADADGDAEADADGPPDAAGSDALAEATGLGRVAVGVGRRPAGSGPTKTNAARMPSATMTPASRPARIVAPDLMRREGTSTDGPEASREGRC